MPLLSVLDRLLEKNSYQRNIMNLHPSEDVNTKDSHYLHKGGSDSQLKNYKNYIYNCRQQQWQQAFPDTAWILAGLVWEKNLVESF